MLLHVLRHVEAQQLDTHQLGELLCDLGLADAGRPGEQVAADRLLRLAQARAGELDRRRQRGDGRSWPNTTRFRSFSRLAITSASDLDTVFGGMRAIVATVASISLHRIFFLRLPSGTSICEAPVSSMTSIALSGSLRSWMYLADSSTAALIGLVRVLELVELLEVGLQALDDLDRVLDRRLLHVDLLEAADERAVLLEVLAVLLVGGRADAAHRARLQRRLQQVGRIHGAARGRTRADHGVDLVDEQDRARIVLDLLHHRLEPLLEVAAIARAGEQRAHVEREDRRVPQHLGHFAANDLARQALGDRRLADAGIADEQRVVLLAPAQHLDGAQHLGLAPDQRIDPAVARLLVEVHAIRVERIRVLASSRPPPSLPAFLVDATHRRGSVMPAAWRCHG